MKKAITAQQAEDLFLEVMWLRQRSSYPMINFEMEINAYGDAEIRISVHCVGMWIVLSSYDCDYQEMINVLSALHDEENWNKLYEKWGERI